MAQAAAVDPVAAMAKRLAAECASRGVLLSWDGWIAEADLARLVDRALSTVRNWRYQSRPLAYHKVAGRIWYEVPELARWMVENDIEPLD